MEDDEFEDEDKFESVEEFMKKFIDNGCEYHFYYNDEDYYICYSEGKYGISDCNKIGRWWGYDTLEEMVDNFKAENGKTMREFILDVNGTFY